MELKCLRTAVWRVVRAAGPLCVCLAALGVSGCIPYTVATTALPVPVGESRSSAITYLFPEVELDPSRQGRGRALSGDLELRAGVDSSSDLGFRLTSFSGLVVNYKRLLSSPSDSARVNVAIMPGLGLVNAGDHLHGELTLIVSGAEHMRARRLGEAAQFVPYGGLRVMQVAPVADGAVHDSPTAGGFLGAKVYSGGIGMSVEIGVFHDRSALGVRQGNVVVVPAVSIERWQGRSYDQPRGRPRRPPRWPSPIPPRVRTRDTSSPCVGPMVKCSQPIGLIRRLDAVTDQRGEGSNEGTIGS